MPAHYLLQLKHMLALGDLQANSRTTLCAHHNVNPASTMLQIMSKDMHTEGKHEQHKFYQLSLVAVIQTYAHMAHQDL